MDGLDIRDLIDLPRLQRIQDRLAQATGFAMISVDYRGIPVTSPSNFTPFCAAIRHKPERRLECFRCDAHGGLQSPESCQFSHPVGGGPGSDERRR